MRTSKAKPSKYVRVEVDGEQVVTKLQQDTEGAIVEAAIVFDVSVWNESAHPVILHEVKVMTRGDVYSPLQGEELCYETVSSSPTKLAACEKHTMTVSLRRKVHGRSSVYDESSIYDEEKLPSCRLLLRAYWRYEGELFESPLTEWLGE